MEAPVLLIIFNRPDYTTISFKAIRKAKPKKLYVFADGPRTGNNSDRINCEKAQEIVKNIDWDCDTKYRFLDQNLGCGYGPSTAISWAFESEDRLIILEDDCISSISFFNYCNHCLDKYFNNERIWVISGWSDHENSKYFYNQDYIFTHYGHTMGWATWKRCWNNFDIDMKKWPVFIKQGGFLNTFLSKEEGIFFNKLYSRLACDKNLNSHSWDYQHVLGIHTNGGISIVSSKNLVQNIGIIGTHSKKTRKYHTLTASEEFKIEKEPEFVLVNREYDLMHFKTTINPRTFPLKRVINKLYRILINQ
jgi:hypothetical protein